MKKIPFESGLHRLDVNNQLIRKQQIAVLILFMSDTGNKEKYIYPVHKGHIFNNKQTDTDGQSIT